MDLPSYQRASNASKTSIEKSSSPDHSHKQLRIKSGTSYELGIAEPLPIDAVEKYFSKVCIALADHGSLDAELLSLASSMQEALFIQSATLPPTIQALMKLILEEINEIHITNNQQLYISLSSKLLRLAGFIEENKPSLAQELPTENSAVKVFSQALSLRVNRISIRVLGLWKAALSTQKEICLICCSLLLFYCEVDPSLNILPNARLPVEKSLITMRNYIANPIPVLTLIKKTKEFIDNEKISLVTLNRINDLLSKTTTDQVRAADKSLSALVMFELISYSLKYSECLMKARHNIDIFPKALSQCSRSYTRLKTQSITQTGPQAKLDLSFPSTTKSNLSTKDIEFKPVRLSQRSNTILTNSSARSTPSLFQPVLSTPATLKKAPIFSSAKSLSSPLKVSRKTIDKNIQLANKLASPLYESGQSSPMRVTRSSECSVMDDSFVQKNVLEEMQHFQLIEEKFKHFLIEKIRKESEKMLRTGMQRHEVRTINEIKAIKNRITWVEEFCKGIEAAKYNSVKKLREESRYKSEVIRALRQIDILDKYNS